MTGAAPNQLLCAIYTSVQLRALPQLGPVLADAFGVPADELLVGPPPPGATEGLTILRRPGGTDLAVDFDNNTDPRILAAYHDDDHDAWIVVGAQVAPHQIRAGVQRAVTGDEADGAWVEAAEVAHVHATLDTVDNWMLHASPGPLSVPATVLGDTSMVDPGCPLGGKEPGR